MKDFVNRVVQKLRICKRLGALGSLRYFFAKKGSELLVDLYGKRITVRKGTPDLGVAMTCFGGEFECLRYCLPREFSGLIVDAGGYIGTSALVLRDLFPKARLVIVEPSSANMSVLKKNVRDLDNVELVYGALVGRDLKTVELRNRGTGEWGFTAVEEPKDKIGAQAFEVTPAYTLSDFMVEEKEIGLLKLDIEGGELDLFKNDLQTLLSVKVVFAELHDKIIDGCTDLFFKYSLNRIVVKDSKEKYLSINPNLAFEN